VVVDDDAGGNKKGDPHFGSMVSEVGISIGCQRHSSRYVWPDGILPIHRKAAIDGFLATFVEHHFIKDEGNVLVLQAAMLKKVSNGLANASACLIIEG